MKSDSKAHSLCFRLDQEDLERAAIILLDFAAGDPHVTHLPAGFEQGIDL